MNMNHNKKKILFFFLLLLLRGLYVFLSYSIESILGSLPCYFLLFLFLFLLKHCICWLDMLNIISKEYSFQGGPLCLVGLIYTYFSSWLSTQKHCIRCHPKWLIGLRVLFIMESWSVMYNKSGFFFLRRGFVGWGKI